MFLIILSKSILFDHKNESTTLFFASEILWNFSSFYLQTSSLLIDWKSEDVFVMIGKCLIVCCPPSSGLILREESIFPAQQPAL